MKTILLSLVVMFVLQANAKGQHKLNYHTFCFYYNWYGNSAKNANEIHWAHPVLKSSPTDTTSGFIPGGDNISSNFYPQLGAYSSTDPATVINHMQMLQRARIGVIVLTWWDKNDFGIQSVPLIMEEAARTGIKVCFHIEPYRGRNAETTGENIKAIIGQYGNHPALFKINGKPMFFVYDSYLTNAEEWASLLQPNGRISIRNTPYDAVMIGLWVKKGEEEFYKTSGFDGFYTYFGSSGFTFGSTPENWAAMQKWATENKKLFIPCVGPGYIDTRVRPWNNSTIRDRENGKYYDRMFKQAIDSHASFIGITSFNEWHEGTQIEPAVPFQVKEFHYLDYSPLAPDYYLERTAYWTKIWEGKTNVRRKNKN